MGRLSIGNPLLVGHEACSVQLDAVEALKLSGGLRGGGAAGEGRGAEWVEVIGDEWDEWGGGAGRVCWGCGGEALLIDRELDVSKMEEESEWAPPRNRKICHLSGEGMGQISLVTLSTAVGSVLLL